MDFREPEDDTCIIRLDCVHQNPKVKHTVALAPTAVIDGELVAPDPAARPYFNLLQNFLLAEAHIHYYAFDIPVRNSKSMIQLPLSKRREILHSVVRQRDHVGMFAVSDKYAKGMLAFVKEVGLEGVIAKRRN